MELARIEEIAKEHNIDIRNNRPRLTEVGDKLKFKSSNEITHAGQSIINFARAIEAEVFSEIPVL